MLNQYTSTVVDKIKRLSPRFEKWIREVTRPRHTKHLCVVTDLFRSKTDLVVENTLLCQQLIVLSRQVKEPKFTSLDRTILVLLSRLNRSWRDAVLIMKPQTILRWHPSGIKLFWRFKKKNKGRKPRVSPESVFLFAKWHKKILLSKSNILMKRLLNTLCLSLSFSAILLNPVFGQSLENESEHATNAYTQYKDPSMEHFLGLHAAVLTHFSYDERYSPIAYSSLNWGGQLHYEFRGTKNHHFLSAIFGIGRAASGFGDRITFVNQEEEKETLEIERTQILGAMNYAYHRVLLTSEKASTKFYLGAILDAYVNIMSSVEFNWLTAYSLNTSTQVTTDLAARHFMAFRFYFPFLTYLCRPPWSIYDDAVMDVPEWKNAFMGRITSIHEYIRLSAELRYEYMLTNTWHLSFIYAFSYFYTNDPTPMHALGGNFLVGVVPSF